MSFRIPPSVNYPSPLHANASTMQDEPKNGRQQISVEVDWGLMGGASNCVSFNVQGDRTKVFDQITSLKVDNSQCGADIVFYWPDVTDTITIPAGSPFVMVPVTSNALQFYVSAPKGHTGDVTRFQLFNYPIPPSDVPVTTESQPASSAPAVIVDGAGGPIQIVAAGIDGTLETLKLDVSVPTAIAATVQTVISVVDGNGNVFLTGYQLPLYTGFQAAVLHVLDFNAANWRFQNGLRIVFTPAGGTGTFLANAFADYKQP